MTSWHDNEMFLSHNYLNEPRCIIFSWGKDFFLLWVTKEIRKIQPRQIYLHSQDQKRCHNNAKYVKIHKTLLCSPLTQQNGSTGSAGALPSTKPSYHLWLELSSYLKIAKCASVPLDTNNTITLYLSLNTRWSIHECLRCVQDQSQTW